MEIWIEKWNNERKTSLWRKKVTIPNTTFYIKDEIQQCKRVFTQKCQSPKFKILASATDFIVSTVKVFASARIISLMLPINIL